jgi:iron complex outermembrane receptor protein
MASTRRYGWLTGAALWALAASCAQAQAVDAIVITARDHAGLLERAPSDTVFGLTRPLIETARSASFISDQTLDRFGVQSVDRLTAVSPGTYTASFFGVPGALNVRGTLAETYFRGFKRIENRGTYATPVGDAARIEIVRGPPTPIFGAGKVGGLINLTPITARDQGRRLVEPNGDIKAEAGAYGERMAAATFNMPLTLGDREGGLHLYGEAERGGEYYRGISPNRYNLQASADLDLNPDWSLAGGLMLHRSRGDVQTPGWNRLTQDLIDNGTYITGRDTSLVDRDGNHRLTPNEISPSSPYPYIHPLYIAYFGGVAGSDAAHSLDVGVGTAKLSRRSVYVSGQDFSRTDTRTAYLDLVRDTGGGVLKLQLFFDELENSRFVSYGFPAQYGARALEGRISYARKVTAGPVAAQTIFGVSTRDYHGRRRESFNSGLIAYDRRDLIFGATATDMIDSPFDSEPGGIGVGWENDIGSRWRQTGAFGTVDISLPSRFNLLLGGRLDRYTARSTDNGVLSYAPPSAADSDDKATWNASLSWNSGGAAMPYVTLAKTSALEVSQAGDLSTGVIANDSWLSDGDLSEAGVKFQLLRGALVGSLAAYRQTRTQLTGGPAPTVQGTRAKGAELELRYLASRHLSFTFTGATQRTTIKGPDASFTYLPAYAVGAAPALAYGGTYVTYSFASLPGRGGDYDYSLIPHGVVSLYGAYTSGELPFGRAGTTLGVTHASHTAGTLQNAVRYPAYSTVNASAFVEHGAWAATLNIDNLFNKLYFTPDADVYANLGAVPGRGREWRLSLKRSF